MKIWQSVLCVAVLAPLLAGIVSCGKPEVSKATETEVALKVCASCGELKGGETCCVETVEVCDSCDLHKGSPGCCKIEKGGEDALICDCGMIKGVDGCCAEDAARCESCEKIKGSPGCCK